MIKRFSALALTGILCCFFAVILFSSNSNAKSQPGTAVIVRALDKVTARTVDLTIRIGEAVSYGTLVITARTCLKRPPEDTPETSTFLEIQEIKQDEDPLMIFNGWMFASSPALNALEHPVYDVWVIDCKMDEAGISNGKE